MSTVTFKTIDRNKFIQWKKEGDGLFASSKKIRDVWKEHQKHVIENVKLKKNKANDYDLLKGLPRSSMLILGYSIEMYLKAGIAKLYLGCREEMFERDVKDYFGHNLKKMADELGFPCNSDDQEKLKLLKNIILFDARYPISTSKNEIKKYADEVNEQTQRIWHKYDELKEIVEKVHNYVSNPGEGVLFDRFRLDENGYLAYRFGERFPSRITYRLGKNMNSLKDVKKYFDDYPNKNHSILILLKNWDTTNIYEDNEKKTVKQQNDIIKTDYSELPNP